MSAERITTMESGALETNVVAIEKYTDLQMRIMEKSEIACSDVTALLGDYIDNDLPVSLRSRIAAQIDICPCCEQNYLEYKQVVLLAGEMRNPPPLPEDVQKRLRDGLSKRLGIKF
jgi:hypothetical protein